MRISVYITSYNQEDYLVEAIESVLAQTLSPFEILILDDCSTDSSRDVIAGYARRYPKLIAGIYHTRNRGIAKTRVEALRTVTGDLVTYLDGDDRFLPGKLENEARLLSENPEAKIAFSNYYLISKDGSRVGVWADKEEPPQGDVFCQVFARDFPKDILFRNELVDYNAWKRIGFHDPRFNLYEDYEMRIRLTKVCKVAYCDEPSSEYRMDHGGLSSVGASRHLAGLEKIVRKNRHLLKDLAPEQLDYVRERVDAFLGRIAERAMQQAIEGSGCSSNRINVMRYYLRSLGYRHKAIDHKFALKLLLGKRVGLRFGGWTAAEGLGPEEGPYPELTVVRWGRGPRTELHFNARGKPLLLEMVCGPHHLPRQDLTIMLNGNRIHHCSFEHSYEFQHIRIALSPKRGGNSLILEYGTWDKTDSNMPLALLFKQMKIVPCKRNMEPD